MAGAAQELKEAVSLNPYDVEAIRRALEIGVAMGEDERRRRMRALDRRVASEGRRRSRDRLGPLEPRAVISMDWAGGRPR